MIINFGSINIDHVYRVVKLPVAGQTISASGYQKYLGGKGVNQSIAIAKSGGEVMHVGAVGEDGDWALSMIRSFGVATDHVERLDGASGHAIVTVDDCGENQIIITGGANLRFSIEMIENALSLGRPENDWVLLQNETNLASEIVNHARSAGFKIAYAAAPFVRDITLALLPFIDLLAVNEGEAKELSDALRKPVEDFPVSRVLVTRGSSGSSFFHDGSRTDQTAFRVEAVDTTGAGDTFLGAFLARYTASLEIEPSLEFATAASAIQVTREGAAPAIPTREEVLKFLRENEAE